jgi:hypothetical protein
MKQLQHGQRFGARISAEKLAAFFSLSFMLTLSLPFMQFG